ncbi:MAG: hypothetical protein ACRDJP_05650, partial [Actinomycetota bacterium]
MDQTEQPRRPAAWWRGVAVLAGLATLVGGAAVVPARAAAPAGAPGADATLGALISGTGQY